MGEPTLEEQARALLPTLDGNHRLALRHVCRHIDDAELPTALVLRLSDRGLVECTGVGAHGHYCRPTDLCRAIIRLLASEVARGC